MAAKERRRVEQIESKQASEKAQRQSKQYKRKAAPGRRGSRNSLRDAGIRSLVPIGRGQVRNRGWPQLFDCLCDVPEIGSLESLGLRSILEHLGDEAVALLGNGRNH